MKDEKQDCRIWFSTVAVSVTQPYEGEHKISTLANLKPWDGLQVPKPPTGPKSTVARGTLKAFPRHLILILKHGGPAIVGSIIFGVAVAGLWELMFQHAITLKNIDKVTVSAYQLETAFVLDHPLGYLPQLMRCWGIFSGTALWGIIFNVCWKTPALAKATKKMWVISLVHSFLIFQPLKTLALVTVCNYDEVFNPEFRCANFVGSQLLDSGWAGVRLLILYPFVASVSEMLENQPWKILGPWQDFSIFGVSALLFIFLMDFAEGSDVMKFVFSVLVNPVAMETATVSARIAARASRHNHQTTSWVLIMVTVLYKKIFARFIIGSISDISIVLVTSVILALVELAGRTTMPLRDAFMYRRVFGAYLDSDANAVALMTNVRSRGLRAETEMIESITDLVFLIQVTFFPILYKISTNGKSSPSVLAALQKAGIQLAVEITMDFLVTMYLAVIQNYHLMTNSQLKVRRYGFIVAAVVVWVQVWFNYLTLAQLMCLESPRVDGTHWVVCGKAKNRQYGKLEIFGIRG